MPDPNPSWAGLPTETEIYILPDGEVVIADLPAELAQALASLSALLSQDEDTFGAPEAVDTALDQSHVAH